MKIKLVKLKDMKSLIEYKGEHYTPEELATYLKVDGNFEIKVHDEDDTWFGRALKKLKD